MSLAPDTKHRKRRSTARRRAAPRRALRAATRPPRTMSPQEFLAWVDQDTRAECVNGEVTMMSPANDQHADLVSWLHAILREFAEYHDAGQVRADLMVSITGPRALWVPDLLCVAADHAQRLKRTHLDGPPDIACGSASPDPTARDWRAKRPHYEAASVPECWVIDPVAQHMEAYTLRSGKYARVRVGKGRAASVVLPGFSLKPAWLWKKPLPKVRRITRELGLV